MSSYFGKNVSSLWSSLTINWNMQCWFTSRQRLKRSCITAIVLLCKSWSENLCTFTTNKDVVKSKLSTDLLTVTDFSVLVLFSREKFSRVSAWKFKSVSKFSHIYNGTNASFVCNVPLHQGTLYCRLPQKVLERKLAVHCDEIEKLWNQAPEQEISIEQTKNKTGDKKDPGIFPIWGRVSSYVLTATMNDASTC